VKVLSCAVRHAGAQRASTAAATIDRPRPRLLHRQGEVRFVDDEVRSPIALLDQQIEDEVERILPACFAASANACSLCGSATPDRRAAAVANRGELRSAVPAD
jgi:hypothetical protein